jgi:hypothetical protein
MIFTATTGEVQEFLRVSKNTLARMRTAEILRPGVHFIAAGYGLSRPNLRWNIDAVQETLQKRGKQIRKPKHDQRINTPKAKAAA